jgi:hypothetical protein
VHLWRRLGKNRLLNLMKDSVLTPIQEVALEIAEMLVPHLIEELILVAVQGVALHRAEVQVPRLEVGLAQVPVAKVLILPLPEDSRGIKAAEVDPSRGKELVRLS